MDNYKVVRIEYAPRAAHTHEYTTYFFLVLVTQISLLGILLMVELNR